MTDRTAARLDDMPARRGKRDKPTRDEILEAAARLIVEEGYGACTMRSLSERVRIKAGSLYHHFSSKDEIVAEVLNMGVTMLLAEVTTQVGRLPADAPFAERFHTAVRAHVTSKVDAKVPYMQVYEHLPPIMKRRSRAMRQQYAEFWVQLFEEAMRSGEVAPDLEVSIVVPYLLGGLNRIPEWYQPKHMDIGRIADVVSESMLHGFRAPAAGAEPAPTGTRAPSGPDRRPGK